MSAYEFKSSPYSSHSLLLARLPQEGRGQTVLDLGCGNGYLSAILAHRGYNVTAVERPGGYTNEFPLLVNLIQTDLDSGLPPMATKFRYVICADILEHLKRPVEMLMAIKGALSADGQVIASLPNSGNVYFRLNVAAGRFPQHDRGLFDRTHLHFYTWHGWVRLLREADFRVESVCPTGIPVELAIPALGDRLAGRVCAYACYCAARSWKTMFAYQFVVTAIPQGKIYA